MGFLSFLTDGVDKLLSPVGIRPFTPSGPGGYPDKGLGDQSLNASKPLQTAGVNFLNLSQGQSNTGSPYANLFGQISQESGVNSPFGGSTSSSSPGELSGSYQEMFNNLKGHTEKARQNALSQLNSHMSARGLGDSSEARAHQAYLNSQFDNHLSDTMSQLQGQQHQERLTTLQNFINSLQGFGALGSNMINGNVQNLNQNAQAATQRTNQGNAAFGSALGLGLGIGGVMPNGMNQFQSPFQNQNQGSYTGAMYGPPASVGSSLNSTMFYPQNLNGYNPMTNPFGGI